MKAQLPLALSVCLVLVCATAMAPLAQADDDDKRIRRLQRSGEILSLEQIFSRARAVKPGRILDVKLDDDDDRLVYEIELLDTRGRVWEIELDARTGKVLELEEDD